jgi:hypothetical protein
VRNPPRPPPHESPGELRARRRDADRSRRIEQRRSREPEFVARALRAKPWRLELWESVGAEKAFADHERSVALSKLLPLSPDRWAQARPAWADAVAAWATHPGTLLRVADLPPAVDSVRLGAARQRPWWRLDRGVERDGSLGVEIAAALRPEGASATWEPIVGGRLRGHGCLRWQDDALVGGVWFVDPQRTLRWTWLFGPGTDDVAAVAEESAPGRSSWHEGASAQAQGSPKFVRQVEQALQGVREEDWVLETQHASRLRSPGLNRFYSAAAPAHQVRVAMDLLESLGISAAACRALLCGGATDAIEVLRTEEARHFAASDEDPLASARSEACLGALVALDPDQGLEFGQHIAEARRGLGSG